MNRRTLKKKCQEAMAILIKDHGYSSDDFTLSDGEETIDAPTEMERRCVTETGFLNPGPLKGTPLVWRQTSTMYNEWAAALPSETLKDIDMWKDVDFSEEGATA